MSFTSIDAGTGAAPWQLQWKSPVWQQVAVATATTDPSPDEGVPVGHCAAAILASEWNDLKIAGSGDEGINERKSSAASVVAAPTTVPLDDALVLTVTLLRTNDDDADNVADVVQVEVFRQINATALEAPREATKNSSAVSCVHSRTLRWPRTDTPSSRPKQSGSTSLSRSSTEITTSTPTCFPANPIPLLALFSGIFGTHARRRDDIIVAGDSDETSSPIEAMTCFPKAPSSRADIGERSSPSTSASIEARRNQTASSSTSGLLVAAALVRVPRMSSNDDKKGEKTITTSAVDAQDMVQFLSLGQATTNNDPGSSADQRPVGMKTRPPLVDSTTSSRASPIPADPAELLLACLTNNGKVHFYSPWSLLEHVDLQCDKVDGMASFLFGESLLTTVHETQLSLSQPKRTISLSVPYLLRPSRSDMNGVDANSRQLQQQKSSPPPPFLSMFDASMWDPLLDRTTLLYQTKDNAPTICIFAFDYLCVAGRGKYRWDRFYPTAASTSGDSTSNTGGFLTFISLQSFSEKRTLFLPFAPMQLSPFHWGGMSFVLVTGKNRAVAVRVDAETRSKVLRGVAPSEMAASASAATTADGTHKGAPPDDEEETHVEVRRFQILPIDVPSNSTSRLQRAVGSDVLVSPPSLACLLRDAARGGYMLVERTLHAIDIAENVTMDNSVLSDYVPALEGPTVVFTTTHAPGHMTRTAISDGDVDDAWFRLGQGWCIVGSPRGGIQFVCFEGSNSEHVAAVHELGSFSRTSSSKAPYIATSILPVDPFRIPYAKIDVGSPARGDYSARQFSMRKVFGEIDSSADADDVIEDIVVEAMESISRLSFRENSFNQSTVSPRKRVMPLTLKEKAEILLDQCFSWTRLDGSHRSRTVSSLVPVTSFRTKSNERIHLSLRSAAVMNGPASSFQDVLTWLSMENNYFTAASVALDLLRDDESLRHLWRSFDKIDRDDECSKLNGLLDGIVPIYTPDHDGVESPELRDTLARLSDLTVCCLVKGGYAMSSTLDQFLSRSTRYDPSRASLMLVATAASVLSNNEEAIGPGDDCSGRMLWPVKCLLKVGVARGRLSPALLMLNTTIPDQLRSRDDSLTGQTSMPPLDMCKSLVAMIVSASSEATELLLDLIDEKTRLRFWGSLEHEIRLEVSLIPIGDKYSLLRDLEVRSWALSELQKCVVNEVSASTANIYGVAPSQWLCALVFACFKNAGCILDDLLHPKRGESKEDFGDESGVLQQREEVECIRKALTPAAGSGGLDFGLLIPSLLVLEHRDVLWHADSETTTRSVLNAVCYMAGRRCQEEPLFSLNDITLMKQCTLLADVEAGANLVGGKQGLILECCRVLINEKGMAMDEAERFLLANDFSLTATSATNGDKAFAVEMCHRTILFLLEEHVLRIRTYGEFAESRGRVDPVLAATLCLRTWLTITHHELLPATRWLMRWLRNRLAIVDRQSVSPNRLACAALVRALIWPERNGTGKADAEPLANMLQLDGLFLVQLSRACCGLVEAVPDYIAEGSVRIVLPTEQTPVKTKFPSQTLPPFTPADSIATGGRSDAVDESFMSAVTSFRDLNTSHGSW